MKECETMEEWFYINEVGTEDTIKCSLFHVKSCIG